MAHSTQPKRLRECFQVAEEKFLALGPSRTYSKLVRVLGLIYTRGPSLSTVKRWAEDQKWEEKAVAYDAERRGAVAVPEFPGSDEAIKHQNKRVFHAKEDLLEVAQEMLQIIKDWERDPKKSKHISCASDATKLVTCTIECIKEAEVLSGRVSDRVAEEKKVTVEEVREKARERAAPLLARLAAVRKAEKEREAATEH